MAEVVEPETRELGLAPGRLKGRRNALDVSLRLGVIEDEIRDPREGLQDFADGRTHGNLPGFPALRVLDQDEGLDEVHGRPGKGQDLAPPHTRLQGDDEDWPEGRRRAIDETPGLFAVQDLLSGVAELELLDLGRGIILGPSPFHRLVEHGLEARQLEIHRRR